MKRALLLLVIFNLSFSFLQAQEIVSVEFLEHRTQAELITEFTDAAGILFGADLYRVTYETPDIHGVKDTASGLFIYPVSENSDKVFPMLIYQHGTVGSRYDVPSELQGGFQLALFWAGVGYATTAADYLGLGTSRGFHPYVHSKTEASAAIDLHLAAKQYSLDNDLYIHDQLFVTGYSQGGHAAAAAQRMIQEDYAGQLEVTACAPMSGPFSISGVMRDLMLGDDPYFFVGYAPYSILSYNLEYNIFEETNEIFKEPVATWVQQFYDEEIDLWQLNEDIIDWLETNFGASVPKYMLKDSIVDLVTNNPDHPINQALRSNDLLNWAPAAPTTLFYCTADDQVPFMNSVIARDSMIASGATALQILDVSPTSDHGGCVTPAVTFGKFFFSSFQLIDIFESTVNLDQNIQFKIVPNPASDHVSIDFINDFQALDQIEILNIAGQSVKTVNNPVNINLSDLSQGVYFVQVVSEDGVWIEKLMLQR